MFKMFKSSSGLSLCSRMGRRFNQMLSRVVVVTCRDHHSLVNNDKVSSSCGNRSSRVNMVVQQLWSEYGSYTCSFMRRDMRGMSAMGMRRCFSSYNDKDNDKNYSIVKNRSNSISDDKVKVRSMNKDKVKKVAFENKTTSNKSSRKGSVYHQVSIIKELFHKPFNEDAIDEYIAMNIHNLHFRTIAFLMQTSSIKEQRLSVQNLRLITAALKSNKIAADLQKMDSHDKMKSFSQLMHSLNEYTDKDDGILDLIPVVTELLNNSEIRLDSQAVGNMIYGMKGMSSDKHDVIELLKVLTN